MCVCVCVYIYIYIISSVFSRIRAKYGEILMRENADQNNFGHGHFLRSARL